MLMALMRMSSIPQPTNGWKDSQSFAGVQEGSRFCSAPPNKALQLTAR